MFAPKKSLGQNFLKSPEIIQQIATSIDVCGMNVIEVGPGEGDLTEGLLQQSLKSLTLIELDTRMILYLTKKFPSANVVHKDVLEFTEVPEEYVLIANIPYYITSPILTHFLWNVAHRPKKMVILMQKEVAEKIALLKGNHPSYLSNTIHLACDSITLGGEVGRDYFYPVPKVDSAFLVFHCGIPHKDDIHCRKLLSHGFLHPRKTLLGNLVQSGYEKENILEAFKTLSFSSTIRPHELSLGDWRKLTSLVNL